MPDRRQYNKGLPKGTILPRWLPDETTGKDTAILVVRAPIDRAQYAILQDYRRDNPGMGLREAMLAALYVGIAELGVTYDSRNKK